MSRIGRTVLVAVATAGLALAPATAQSAAAGDGRPVLTARRTATPPVLDGDVLEDPAWEGAVAATAFRQTTPDEGEPSSERTEVFVVYDDEALYVGVVCHDREPRRIIVSDSRRDSSLAETDSFQLILDTYADRQGGFVFGTNPAGLEFDGQVTGTPSGGLSSGNTFDRNWDAAWEVRTRVGDFGWSAEFAIPFRSLRFPRENGVWGVNFQRNIRRRNESAYWAPLPRQFDLYWVSLAGRLEGIEPPRQRTIQLTPYALAESRRERVAGAGTTTDEDFGLDFKLGLSPSLTLDATVNTDFAQVEADEQQINLDRFNLFFPEKRPFFLENAGLFRVGVPEEVELFFSRRIGLGPGGEEIPIDGGLRLSGKLAGRHNLGLLVMRADEVAGIAPENDFLVARYSRDLRNRSSVGAIVVDRQGSGAVVAGGSDENRTLGVDGRWGIGRYGAVQGFYARTDTPGLDGDDHALRVGGTYDSEEWSTSLYYSEVGENFNPEVGFLRRSGYRKPEFRVLYRYRPKDWWGLQELRPHISYSGFWNFDDFQETGFLHVDNHWEYKSGLEFHTGVNFRHEGVTEDFELADGVVVPAGEYDDEEAQLVFFTNRGAPVGFETRLVFGGFFGGDRVAVTPALRFRVGETFNTEIEWAHNDIDLPGGSFETNLGRMRLNYSFTPRVFLQGLLQYNDRAAEWAANLRFAWLQDANTGFFVVYNEVNDIGSAGAGVAGRSLIVKYSRLVDLSR